MNKDALELESIIQDTEAALFEIEKSREVIEHQLKLINICYQQIDYFIKVIKYIKDINDCDVITF